MKSIKNVLKPYLDLDRSIHVLFFSTIINQMGNFVGPLITLFLTYNLGLEEKWVGILVAISAGFGLLGSMIGGKIIDTYGRKKVLILFKSLSAGGYILCAFMTQPVLLVLTLLLVSFISGLTVPVLSTLVTDLTHEGNRKTAFSLNYLAINIGFAVGPLVATLLYEQFLKLLFIGDALTSFLSLLLIARYVPDTFRAKTNKRVKTYDMTLVQLMKEQGHLIVFSLAIVLVFTGFSQFSFGLPLQVKTLFDNAKFYGLLMTLNAVACFVLTIPVTHLTRKMTASKIIMVGSLLYALGFGMLVTGYSYIWFIASTLIWTLGEIMVSVNTSVYIANHTPITHRGRFNALFPVIRKTGSMLGPIIGGLVVTQFGIRYLWPVIACLACLAAGMMLKLSKQDHVLTQSKAS